MQTNYTKLAMIVLSALLAAGCAQNAAPQPQTAAPAPATATPAALLQPTTIPTPTATSLPLPTIQANCTDSALYVQDISIPDNTRLKPGEAFTKIWRLRNTGKCIWNMRYALVFVGGEQMGGVVTTPLSETPPGETLDIAIDLVAPAKDGQYTGLYELRTPQGRAIYIGSVTSIWVRILVGNASLVPAIVPTGQTAAAAPAATPVAAASGPCSPQQNGGYVSEIFALINSARADAKLRELNLNSQLNNAAQAHSDDMACNNFASHTGSNGSSIHSRVAASGYTPSYSEEIMYAGGAPQDAFNWWINDKTHRDALLNPNARDVGIGYTYLSGTAYGSYITVDFAAP